MLVQTFSGAARRRRRRPRRQKREAEVEVDGADQPSTRVGAGSALASGGGGGGSLPNSGIGLSAGSLQVRKWKKFWATLSRTQRMGFRELQKILVVPKRVLGVSKGSHDTPVRETSVLTGFRVRACSLP